MRFSLIALAITFSSAVSADTEEEQARAQFEQGIELFEQGKHEQAAIAFERAYNLKPSYKILYNIGQVQKELEHYAAALVAYTRYLDEGGAEIDAARAAEVKALIKRLNTLVGLLVIETAAVGASIYVDDQRQGETPLQGPVFVDMGKHTVVIKLGTEELHREVVKVAGGQTVTINLGSEPVDEEPVITEPLPAIEEDDSPKRIWTWVAFGVGGAAGIGAGITGGLANSKRGALDESCSDGLCPESQQDNIDSMKTLATTTDVLIGVAAAGVAAGIVLFFIEPRFVAEEELVAVAPVLVPNGGGVSIGGRF